ncbi:MAG: type II secretion system F family protein [Candidatus Omnitrophica bacterium]|nr:type II secretion system F family protein [Candidatus Omnitrophota bacterium]
MPKFFYIVRDAKGNKNMGFEEATSPEELTARLQSKGLVIVNILSDVKEGDKGLKSENLGGGTFKPRHYRISGDDLVLFCRHLATLLGAGVTILKSLDVISKQVASRRLYQVIKDLEKNMEAGLSFHEAMAKHPSVFSDLWVNIVESGEASGSLAVVLNRLASYLERNASFRRKIISALIYPLILLAAGTGALLFLTIKIIPTFAQLFEGFKMKLPFLTLVLIRVSFFIRNYFLILVGIVLIGLFLLKRFISTPNGRRKFEKLKFNLPLFGDFFRVLIIERFSSEMSTLVESGVPILYSLEITEHSVDNLIMADIVRKIKEDVREGKSLSRALERYGFFDPMVVQMISIGEEIGELSNMFKRLNVFYQEYVETFLTRFTALFEPIMLLFMALVIGTMVIGMFLPIFQIAQLGTG